MENTDFYLTHTTPTPQIINALNRSCDAFFSSKHLDTNFSINPILIDNGVFGLSSLSRTFRDTILRKLGISDIKSLEITLLNPPDDINSIKNGTLMCSFDSYPEAYILLDFDIHQLLKGHTLLSEPKAVLLNILTGEEHFTEFKNLTSLDDAVNLVPSN